MGGLVRAKDVASFYRDLEKAIETGKREALKSAALHVQKSILAELDAGTPGRGREYQRGRGRKKAGRRRRKGVTHRASLPGEAPATDTGRLRRAVGLEVEGSKLARVGVKALAPYAKILDPPEGERAPKIGRRPFVSSGWRKSRTQAQQIITDELARALKAIS